MGARDMAVSGWGRRRGSSGGGALGEELERGTLAEAAAGDLERNAEAALGLGEDQRARKQRAGPLRVEAELARELASRSASRLP